MEYLQMGLDFIKEHIVLALLIGFGITFIIGNKVVSKTKTITKASKGGVAINGNQNKVEK
jgi:hypothetical protein